MSAAGAPRGGVAPCSRRVMNLAHFLRRAARRFPDAVGLAWGARSWTWAELDARVDAMAAALAARGVVQVKAPAELLVRAASGGRDLTDIAVEDLVALVARAGLRLVAEGVEREADVPDLLDLDVPFAQGPVFAEPRAVRADVLGAPPAAPEPEETGPPPPRRGFRDFLRRAG